MSDKSIKDRVLEMLTTPMRESFEKHGISSDYLARKIKEEMNYKEPVSEMIVESQGKKKVTRKVIRKVKTVGAMAVRQKARESAHRLLSHFPPDRKEFAGPGGLPLGAEVESRPIKIVFVDPAKESKE